MAVPSFCAETGKARKSQRGLLEAGTGQTHRAARRPPQSWSLGPVFDVMRLRTQGLSRPGTQ